MYNIVSGFSFVSRSFWIWDSLLFVDWLVLGLICRVVIFFCFVVIIFSDCDLLKLFKKNIVFKSKKNFNVGFCLCKIIKIYGFY